MPREFELKYAAGHAQLAAIHAIYPDAHPITMETIYYDTPGNTLSPHHRTLRRRLGNGISVCTLKLPLGDGSRTGEVAAGEYGIFDFTVDIFTIFCYHFGGTNTFFLRGQVAVGFQEGVRFFCIKDVQRKLSIILCLYGISQHFRY